MKIKFLVIVFISLFVSAKAQLLVTQQDSLSNLVSISTHLRNTGKVAIYQDSRLESLITHQPKAYYANSRRGKGSDIILTQGYRIRAFSGNNQVTSKNQAYKIEKDLKQYDPDLATYVIFKSPNWRLLVGNFTTNEEAVTTLRELKKRFPEYGREMFVVKDEIEISR